MQGASMSALRQQLAGLDPDAPGYAAASVDAVLAAACAAGASDVHLQPVEAGLELKFRVDGVLAPVAVFPARMAGNLTARLKVLAGLLTYHTDRPQEGRLRLPRAEGEMRVCTFPTLHGERTVVRLFGGTRHYQYLDDLGLPDDVLQGLRPLLAETSGAIVVSGPAGSGKTTTAYAGLARSPAATARSGAWCRSRIPSKRPWPAWRRAGARAGRAGPGRRPAVSHAAGSRGDPHRRDSRSPHRRSRLAGLADRPPAPDHLSRRQRRRDRGPPVGHGDRTVCAAQRAAGHRQSAAVAPPVLLHESTADPDARLGLAVGRVREPRGCGQCGGTGYRGRLLLVEMLTLARHELASAILARSETAVIQRLAAESGMQTRWQRACRAVDEGLTSPAEVRRVLGLSGGSAP